MFIELTDHLRCPASHDESFLVLLPDEVVNRQVRSGTFGCPVCNAQYPIVEGVVRFGPSAGPAPLRPSAPASIPALAAFLGLSGPGGYVGLVGDVATLGRELVPAVPGVHFVGINAPAGTEGAERLSLLEAPMIPVKKRQLRGVVLGGGYGDDAAWVAEGARAVLPGLRVVGAGEKPEVEGLEVLAAAEGWWVAVKK